jgi:hypothetical protein
LDTIDLKRLPTVDWEQIATRPDLAVVALAHLLGRQAAREILFQTTSEAESIDHGQDRTTT